MDKDINNPPAFPYLGEIFIDGPQGRQPQSAWGMEGSPGMSLRDKFADTALVFFAQRISSSTAGQWFEKECAEAAEASYKLADAMLKERQKGIAK